MADKILDNKTLKKIFLCLFLCLQKKPENICTKRDASLWSEGSSHRCTTPTGKLWVSLESFHGVGGSSFCFSKLSFMKMIKDHFVILSLISCLIVSMHKPDTMMQDLSVHVVVAVLCGSFSAELCFPYRLALLVDEGRWWWGGVFLKSDKNDSSQHRESSALFRIKPV